jgi:hypothetical protein
MNTRNNEAIGVLLIFIVIFLSALAIFGVLLAQTGGGDLEINLNYVPWWGFFIVSFLYGAAAGLKHLAAVMESNASKRASMMRCHFKLWIISGLFLAASFGLFWSQMRISWIWFIVGVAICAAIFVGDRKNR